MKSLKKVFTLIICTIMLFVIAASELLYCAHSTIMSPSHIAGFLDDDQKLSQLTVLIYSSLAEPSEENSSKAIRNYAVNILNKVDQAWVKSQVYIGTTGLHKYIVSEAATLPTLDFVPLNTIIRESIVSEIMKQPESSENVKKVKTILSILNNKYFGAIIKYGLSTQLISMLLELAPIQSTGFTRTTIQEIIKIYLSLSNKGITLDQASYSITEQMVAKSLELDKLKDYFSLDLFLEKAFGDNNPIASLKTLISRVDTSLSRLTKILFWCLVLLLLINFQLSLIKLLKLMLYSTSLASIFNVLLSALLINPTSSQKLIKIFFASPDSISSFWTKLWIFFLRDFGLYLALQSVIVSIVAGVSYLIIKLLSRKPGNTKNKVRKFALWRFSFIIIILALSFSWWSLSSMDRDIKTFQSSILELKSTDISNRIVIGLREAGGMEFFKYIQKK